MIRSRTSYSEGYSRRWGISWTRHTFAAGPGSLLSNPRMRAPQPQTLSEPLGQPDAGLIPNRVRTNLAAQRQDPGKLGQRAMKVHQVGVVRTVPQPSGHDPREAGPDAAPSLPGRDGLRREGRAGPGRPAWWCIRC